MITFLVGEYLFEDLIELGIEKRRIVTIKPLTKYRLNGGIEIVPLKLYHNVENMGLRIFYKGKKLFHATDTYSLKGIKAINYDYYLIERNYCEEVVEKRIKDAEAKGSYTHSLDARENHLSKQKLELWLAKNNRLNKGEVIYLHESSENLWI